VAGIVVEQGDGVEVPAVGQAVIGFMPMTGPGAAAEFAAAPAAVLVSAPANGALADAAAIPIAALTAWQALFDHGELTPGQRVLINVAGDGGADLSCNWRRKAAATASARSAETARTFGADEVIDYTTLKISDAVRKPVDLVVNLVASSGEVSVALLDVTKPGGILVSVPPGVKYPERDVRVVFFGVRWLKTPIVHERSEAGAVRGRVVLIS
jgi:NADPH:quinone reductase-like Zn-dependent oxidoreductase